MAQENAEVKSRVVEQDVATEQSAAAEQDAAGRLSASDGSVVEQGKHAPKQKAPVNKNSLKYI